MTYFLTSLSCGPILMTSLVMQIRVKTNFVNDIFNQMDKELGKKTIFFVFYYRVSYDRSNYLGL